MTNKTKTILCVCALTASAFAWNTMAANNTYEDTVTYSDSAWFLDVRSGGLETEEDLESYKAATGNKVSSIDQTSFTALVDGAHLSISMEWLNKYPNDFSFGIYKVSNEDLAHNEMEHPILLDSNNNYKSLLFDSAGNPLFTKIELDSVDVDNEKEVAEVLSKTYSTKDYVAEGFSKGDLVGLWVEDSITHITYYSDNSLTLKELADLNEAGELDYLNKYPVAEGQNPYTAQYAEGFNEREKYGDAAGPATGDASVWFDNGIRKWYNYEFDGWQGEGDATSPLAQLKFRVDGVAPASDGGDGGQVSNGYPLPGVWATIALAGAASAYLKRRRKENK